MQKQFYFPDEYRDKIELLITLMQGKGYDLANKNNPRATSDSKLIQILIDERLAQLQGDTPRKKPVLPDIDRE